MLNLVCITHAYYLMSAPIHDGLFKKNIRFLDPRVPILWPSTKFGSKKTENENICCQAKIVIVAFLPKIFRGPLNWELDHNRVNAQPDLNMVNAQAVLILKMSLGCFLIFPNSE